MFRLLTFDHNCIFLNALYDDRIDSKYHSFLQINDEESYDYIRVYDGNYPKNSNILTEVSGVYFPSGLFPSSITSSSNQLLITYTSDDYYRSVGFKARINKESLKDEDLSADDCTMKKPCKAAQGHCQSDDECQGSLICGQNNCPYDSGYLPNKRCCYEYCSQWLDMENGILTSPRFPNSYPSDLRCHTLITVGMTVAGPRTITLEFLQFKVCF